jgi:hypothetical protein
MHHFKQNGKKLKIWSLRTKKFSSQNTIKKIKKGNDVWFWAAYGRFLSNKSARTAPTNTITTRIAATAGTKYWSVVETGSVVAFGVAVAASSATNAVCAEEP